MTATTSNRSTGAWVATLCWLAVLLDGFDLVVLGAVLPSLLDYRPWGLTPASASLVTTVGLVGMTIGALTIGTLTDVVGRRKALIGAVASFSLFTLLCAFAPGPGAFGVLRFLAGLGLGGCLPTAIALVNEFSRGHRGGRATTTVMTGYHVGAVATAALAIAVIPHLGWRAMFVLGALPALVLVPLMLRHLPESASYLLAHGRREEAEAVAARYGLELEPDAAPADGHAAAASAPAPARVEATGSVKVLFSPAYLRNSIAIWVTSFMGLLLVYGLNTWLPQLMRVAGYDLGAALAFLLVLNVGAVVGLLVAGRVADRVGARTAGIGWFCAAAVFLALLSIRVPLGGIYVMVFLAGVFVFSAQVLVYAFTSANHPPQVRATALGWSAGVGRVGAICGPILGGAVLAAGVAVPWGFYAFAVVGALGAVALSTSRVRRPDALGASVAAAGGYGGARHLLAGDRRGRLSGRHPAARVRRRTTTKARSPRQEGTGPSVVDGWRLARLGVGAHQVDRQRSRLGGRPTGRATAPVEPALEQDRQTGQPVVDDDEQHGHDQEGGHDVLVGGADLVGLVEQLLVGDDVAQGRVLEHHDELPDQRRQHRRQRLRQQDRAAASGCR